MSAKIAHLPVPPLVVALAYDRLCTFEFGCVIEMFALQRPELEVDWYRFEVCSLEPGPIRAFGGVTMEASHGPSLLDQADIILIPGWRDPAEKPPQILIDKLQAAYARGSRICSICSGVFVLAWSGLLDGKAATTHWRLTKRLAEAFPAILVEPNVLYVDAGQIMTSAGSASGLDMMLHLVRTDFGTRVANLVARRLIVAPHREGGQAQFLQNPLPSGIPGRLTKLMEWIRENLTLQHTLRSLADQAAMSPRSLQRQFQEASGLSPFDWVVRERILVAKELLEGTETPIDTLSEQVGFGSEESFRRHFRLWVRTTPTAYRRSFRSRESA
jgi:AraC family transcriptional activator FtrA